MGSGGVITILEEGGVKIVHNLIDKFHGGKGQEPSWEFRVTFTDDRVVQPGFAQLVRAVEGVHHAYNSNEGGVLTLFYGLTVEHESQYQPVAARVAAALNGAA